MTTYEFSLVFQLAEGVTATDDVIDRLYEAGCSDATLGIGRPGQIEFMFARRSTDAATAIKTAIEDVMKGAPGARLIEAGPDLVGLTDVADMVGVSRQNMRKLMLANPDSFPTAVHHGSASIWHLVDVLAWLHDKGTYAVERAVLDLSRVTQQLNALRESMRVTPGFARKFGRFVS